MRVHCFLYNTFAWEVGPINLVPPDELALDELVGPVIIVLLRHWTILENLHLFLDVLLELDFDIQ